VSKHKSTGLAPTIP